MGVIMFLDDPSDAAAAKGGIVSIHISASAAVQGGSKLVIGCLKLKCDKCFSSWSTGLGVGCMKACTWSQLQEASRSGAAALDITLAWLDSAAPLAADAALHMPSAAGRLSAQQLLGGPFSDVAVTCGGRRFAAHRAVLVMASPVFLSMLGSEMVEGGGAPEVEIREADPAALELLLRHAYGATVAVPLALAPQLCGLADRFQLRTDLAEQLLLWLSTVDVQPAALCDLLPAACALCPYACNANLYFRAAEDIAAVMAAPAFGSWPVEVAVEVIRNHGCNTAVGFAAAAAWMAAQPRPARQRHHWPALLAAVRWRAATRTDLRAIRAHPGAAAVLGLQERLLDALFDLCARLEGAQGGADEGHAAAAPAAE